MSLDLRSIPVQQLPGPATQLIGKQVATCTPLQGVPVVSTVVLSWNSFLPSWSNNRIGVLIDMQATQQPGFGALDKVRSVKIDNSYCAVPIYVQATDTQDTIVCPAYSIVTAPIYTLGVRFIVYGTQFYTGRPPQTTVEFANFDRQGFVLTDVAADGIRILPIATAVDNTMPAVSIPFNLANVPEAPDRVLIAGFTHSANGVVSTMVTFPQFSGIVMSTTPIMYTGGSGAANYAASRIGSVFFPRGQGTYNLTYTAAADVQTVVVSLFAIYGATITTNAVMENGEGTVNVASLSIPVPQPVPGGIVFGVASGRAGASAGTEWRNAEILTYYDNIAGGNVFHSTAYKPIEDIRTFSVGANPTTVMALDMFI